MYRLYAQYDTVAVRTARRYNDLKKAAEVASKIHAKCVEIRELLPCGNERLVDIYERGRSCAT
jgi:hypothetical protein